MRIIIRSRFPKDTLYSSCVKRVSEFMTSKRKTFSSIAPWVSTRLHSLSNCIIVWPVSFPSLILSHKNKNFFFSIYFNLKLFWRISLCVSLGALSLYVPYQKVTTFFGGEGYLLFWVKLYEVLHYLTTIVFL